MIDWAGDLLDTTEADFAERYRQSALYRTGRDGLLRNLCVGLGNAGSVAATPVLRRAAADASELVREHATWALVRLGESPAPD